MKPADNKKNNNTLICHIRLEKVASKHLYLKPKMKLGRNYDCFGFKPASRQLNNLCIKKPLKIKA